MQRLMYIVGTSFMVEDRVHQAWLESVRGLYIPALKEAGYDRLTFTRVISAEPTGAFTYSLQVAVPDMEAYRQVNEQLMARYGKTLRERFGEQVLWFTSLLKRVEY